MPEGTVGAMEFVILVKVPPDMVKWCEPEKMVLPYLDYTPMRHAYD